MIICVKKYIGLISRFKTFYFRKILVLSGNTVVVWLLCENMVYGKVNYILLFSANIQDNGEDLDRVI